VTLNLTQSIEEQFEERAARAQFLAQQSSAARDPLLFASAILREQALLAHALESAALTGNLEADVEILIRLGKTLLHGAAAHGPEALAQEARKRIDEENATARTRLLVYWSDDSDDYLARALLQPYVEVLRARQLTPDRIHKRGRCPFCGGAPMISARKAPPDAEAGLRMLRCAVCALEWNVNRIYCPACFEEDPYKLPLFRSDAHPNVRIEACETCRHYVKSIDLTQDARPIPEVDDLLSVSMDLWAIDEGFTRIEPGLAGI
jgi:formate dehydrogenase maturation protein FdhE